MMRKMRNQEAVRVRNPFLDPLVTELIDDPDLYRRVFSERILVGETLQVFQPVNAVLLGPQGSGKSMILNLIRYPVLSGWLKHGGALPSPLRHVKPFLGISINLGRANLHAFGRRSVAKSMGRDDPEHALDTPAFADFVNHFLFGEFLRCLKFVSCAEGHHFCDWLGLHPERLEEPHLAAHMASWDSWFDYYTGCNSYDALLDRCEKRLSAWRSFLNANIDSVPSDIWRSKSTIGDPLHKMGNLLSSVSSHSHLPLFVVIDQYEVLPELNISHGTSLQRAINTMIKARDPVVFFKLGARTYDWGTELRIWGAESRIEVQRDYVTIDLSNVLMRNEQDIKKGTWLFPQFAQDVAYKRIKEGRFGNVSRQDIKEVFGSSSPEEESWLYFRDKERRTVVLRGVPKRVADEIRDICGPSASPLELRLAAAWARQCLQRGMPLKQVRLELNSRPRPWKNQWWRKERIGVALLQIASLANQRKIYRGWDAVTYLSGANITAFLLICNEIWDVSTKMGLHPLRHSPLPQGVQTQGIFLASEKWRERDRNEQLGGSRRYAILARLGPAIGEALIRDLAISNPGHSGFSLREADLLGDDRADDQRAKVAQFLHQAVSWAILEERTHTSKKREGASRRKWYLHPLLSPVFQIPHVRVKEPLYTNPEVVYVWLFGTGKIVFGHNLAVGRPNKQATKQLRFPL